MLNLFRKKKLQNQVKKYTQVLFFTFFIWFLLYPSIKHIAFILIYSIISTILITELIGEKVSQKMLKIITISFIFKKDFYKYLIFLVKEICTSSLHVLYTAIKMKKFQDDIIKITLPKNVSTHKIFLIVISTTLTPGTSVIDIDQNILTIHCLTQSVKNSTQEMLFINKILSFKF